MTNRLAKAMGCPSELFPGGIKLFLDETWPFPDEVKFFPDEDENDSFEGTNPILEPG